MAERAPYQIIEEMVQARATPSDDEVLAQIAALAVDVVRARLGDAAPLVRDAAATALAMIVK